MSAPATSIASIHNTPPAIVRPAAGVASSSALDQVCIGQLPPDPYLLRGVSLMGAPASRPAVDRIDHFVRETPHWNQMGQPTRGTPAQGELSTGRVSPRVSTFIQDTYANDAWLCRDGFDSSRDICGIEADEGRPDQPYVLRLSLNNLKPDAANDHLDVYWLIGTGAGGGTTRLPDSVAATTAHPWNLAVAAYDEVFSSVVDASGKKHPGALKSACFDPVRRTVEIALDKQALRESGWRDGAPLTLQAFTTRDLRTDIVDTLDDPREKPWLNGGVLKKAVTTTDPAMQPRRRSEDWAGESIYFTLTDRFHNGDRTNDFGVDHDLRHYQGGDLRGVIDKLDYIKDLGMSTVWISPPFENQTRFGNYDGFHGYWPIDFYKVDARQGDMATLKELVQKAHERGMKVVMDLPLNQAAWEHPWSKDPGKRDWFHHIGDINDWEDPYQVEHGDIMGLPDLAQESPVVADELIRIAKHWIDETGIDGFRLDAVKHVTYSFWPQFARSIHEHAGPDFLLLGEDLHGHIPHVSRYQAAGMESMLDFPTYYAIRDSIGAGGSMAILADRLAEENAVFDNARMLSLFIDNHDMNRFMSDAARTGDARRKLQLALSLMFTINRIPNVYMGDEVGMDGTQEMDNPEKLPYNRKNMEFDRDPEMLAWFKKLASLRKNNEALREGGYVEAWRDESVFAFERPSRNGTAFVVLNGSGDGQHRDIPIPGAGNLKDGMRLRDAITGQEVVIQNGRIRVDVSGRAPRVYLPV